MDVQEKMLPPGKHPADDPIKVKAMGMAMSVGDREAAREIAADMLIARKRHDAKKTSK